ncbi:hypothetical protein DU508_23215 [Pedobacter chinensis]|uniref:Uncharacterized protein n=1 Tax=Pedobacter chinensis TaxID=2282421 RepID=A0A369PS84_9SPHI|nr:hypothetical protein DU508_23215 [Pedobacter chinensis]
MHITVYTNDAKKLVTTIKEYINNGTLKTWSVHIDSKNHFIFYHSTKSEQWENSLYVKPFGNKLNTEIYFKLTEDDGIPIECDSTYGYLLGRFVEILIVHLSNLYERIEIK